jgi:hypothetical protein
MILGANLSKPDMEMLGHYFGSKETQPAGGFSYTLLKQDTPTGSSLKENPWTTHMVWWIFYYGNSQGLRCHERKGREK